MEKTLVDKFQQSLKNMRLKVVEAKGESIKGLSPLPKSSEKNMAIQSKIREPNT